MANLAFDLPLPVLNGDGAAVDVSTLSAPLTFTCVGQLAGANLTIEISNDGGVTYSPLVTFQGVGGTRVIPCAAQWLRVNVSGRGSKPFLTFSANVDVGGPDGGSAFATLAMPVLNGAGASQVTSAFERLCTFVCTGSFPGAAVLVQISEDNVDWSTLCSFNGRGGVISRVVSAQRMRAFVQGRVAGDPFTAVLAVGTTELGGAGSGIDVEDEGVPVGTFSTFNFTGAGVTATDAGGGVADVAIPGGAGAATSGGEAGVTGAGTALDPLVPVAGPFRPVGSVFVFDDYMTYYPLDIAGTVLGTGNTSILMNGVGGITAFSVNDAAGPLGPGVGSMMGVMDLIIAGAGAGDFISATQFRDGNDSGQCINMALLQGAFDLVYASRVSFEGLGNFEANQMAFAGFREQIDLSVIGVREGAWFHPKDNGAQVNWFAFYRIADDSGIVTADVDTGVRVGFTATHPADGKAAQNLMVRFTGPAAAAELNMYIDGVLEVGPIALVNPTSRFTPMESLTSIAAAQSNTMYVDWALWYLNPGRTV